MSATDLEYALGLIERGKTADAVDQMERLVAALPIYAAAHAALARAYEADRQWERALVAWQKTQFLVPNSSAAEAGLARAIETLTSLDDTDAPPFGQAPAGSHPGSHPDALIPPPAPDWTDPPAAVDPPRLRDIEELAAEDAAAAAAQGEHYEDLDRLIEELETARIRPNPYLETLPTPDLDDDIEDMVSETLARIYETQNQYEEAARAYEKLAAQHPERADEFTRKAATARSRRR